MEISNNLEAYFKSLIEPLATNKDIEGMFIKFKEEIVNEFEENIRCQEEKINRLEGTVNIQANVIKNLEIRSDNLEQYSRRISVRVHQLETSENESESELVLKIEYVLRKWM